MDYHRVQVSNNLNDNSDSDQGGNEISGLGDGSIGEPWSPEKALVLFAIKLLSLMRISYAIRALGVFWASTVLLPNLVNVPYGTDFYFIVIILLAEGARIFFLNYDLDWRLRTLWTISSAVKSRCGYSTREVIRWKSTSTGKSDFLNKLIYCLQLLSALICITLSVMRFIQLSIGDAIHPSSGGYRPAAYMFYALAFAQAFFSLLEEAYWEWTITCRRLLEVVDKESHLGIDAIKSFFYHAYWECDKGKISNALTTNLFSFASKLLNSHFRSEQLIGVQILHNYSTNCEYSNDTLRNIRTSMPVMEKLLYMLSWKMPEDATIRRTAAEILVKLPGRSSFQLSGFPGALDYISALLDDSFYDDDDDIGSEQKCLATLGIKILAKLSYNRDNCEEIAHTRRLLLKLLDGLVDPVLRNRSAKILYNLCKNVGEDCFRKVRGVVAVAHIVLGALMRSEESEQPERLLALTTKLFSFMTPKEAKQVLDERYGSLTIADLTTKLVGILNKNKAILEQPNGMSPKQLDEVRQTTCNAISLANETMTKIEDAVSSFKIFGMKEELLQIQEATRSDMDCKFIHHHLKIALDFLAE